MARRGDDEPTDRGAEDRGASAVRRAGVAAGVLGAVAGAGWLARRVVERRVFAAVRGDR